ncbi:hypothetical protein F4781DRAFT_393187 [Annulohypoxylon bovei var. microspora]|nr:hypothetical protein F4781DRAFT_393187 [Annulohypoxylon bovei var. microspora]
MLLVALSCIFIVSLTRLGGSERVVGNISMCCQNCRVPTLRVILISFGLGLRSISSNSSLCRKDQDTDPQGLLGCS